MHCAFSSPIGPAPVQCASHTVRRISRTGIRAASVPQPSRCTPGKRTTIVRASGNSCRLDVCLLPKTFVLSERDTGNISAAFLPAHYAACSVALEIASPPTASPPLITITDAALKNLKRLREDAGNEKVLLRMGVRSGGCSGIPKPLILLHALKPLCLFLQGAP